LKIEGRCFFKK